MQGFSGSGVELSPIGERSFGPAEGGTGLPIDRGGIFFQGAEIRGRVLRCFRWSRTRARAGQPRPNGSEAKKRSHPGTVDHSPAIHRWDQSQPHQSPGRDERNPLGSGVPKPRHSLVPPGFTLPSGHHPSDESLGYLSHALRAGQIAISLETARNQEKRRAVCWHDRLPGGDGPRLLRARDPATAWEGVFGGLDGLGSRPFRTPRVRGLAERPRCR